MHLDEAVHACCHTHKRLHFIFVCDLHAHRISWSIRHFTSLKRLRWILCSRQSVKEVYKHDLFLVRLLKLRLSKSSKLLELRYLAALHLRHICRPSCAFQRRSSWCVLLLLLFIVIVLIMILLWRLLYWTRFSLLTSISCTTFVAQYFSVFSLLQLYRLRNLRKPLRMVSEENLLWRLAELCDLYF